MMNKMDIERMVDEKLVKMRKQMIEELQGQVESNNDSKTIWDLNIKDGEMYYRLSWKGDAIQDFFESSYDKKVRDINGAFLTREEAEFEVERKKVEAVMKKYSRPFENNRDNYCLYFYNCISIQTGFNSAYNYGVPCFETEEIAEKVIDEIGEDRLKKYWFGVQDDE
ncbi:MAG: hypothetical protein ACTTKY_00625 [Catonella sp.]